ncbi:MAG: hypothetical protein M3680_17985 [Myxococcota bacterium]|nr:hypothetical protein [Myxococcota bacterium]
MASRETERELVLQAVTDAFNDFVHGNRKLDRDLPWDRLEQLVRDGVVSKREIVEQFTQHVERWNVGASDAER